MTTETNVNLPALLGGPKAVHDEHRSILAWPIITAEDEQAVIDVMRNGTISGNSLTRQFEREFADYLGVPHALGACNGTASLLEAMWACGVRRGDEIIAPSLTYWASVMPAWSLGANIVFADVEPHSLCLDPADVQRRITKRTRAIIAVHLCGHPCNMDALMDIAARHDIKVIEDASHAHGGLYKGRPVGTIGHAGCFSLMAGKSLVAGEAGMLVTSDRLIWERAIAFGFYERTTSTRWTENQAEITDPELAALSGLPLGGVKHRMNQMCAALGRGQLKHYPKRMAEIDRAMHYFWSCLDGLPGIRPLRVDQTDGSTMAAWYYPHAHYAPEELSDLPLPRLVQAIAAEGVPVAGGIYNPLHLHPVFHKADVFGQGRPTAIANCDRDIRCGPGSLPVTEQAPQRSFMVPWLKTCNKGAIEAFAHGIRKVITNADKLKESS